MWQPRKDLQHEGIQQAGLTRPRGYDLETFTVSGPIDLKPDQRELVIEPDFHLEEEAKVFRRQPASVQYDLPLCDDQPSAYLAQSVTSLAVEHVLT